MNSTSKTKKPKADIKLQHATDVRWSYNASYGKKELAAVFRGIARHIEKSAYIEDITSVKVEFDPDTETHITTCMWTGYGQDQ